MISPRPTKLPRPWRGGLHYSTRHAASIVALLFSVWVCGGLAGCSAGATAPQFDYTLLDGSRAASRDLRGQVVLVSFWATSCAPCVRGMPELVETHRLYQGRGFQTLAVAMRHDAPARVAEFAQRRQLPFGVVIDNTGAIAAAFGDVPGTPTAFLIGADGHIIQRYVGELNHKALRGRLDKLLAAI